MLPREYLSWQTVHYRFWKWHRDGQLRRARDRLREAVREAEGREAELSAAVIDSQAVKENGGGRPRARLRRSEAALGEEAPSAGGHRRVRTRSRAHAEWVWWNYFGFVDG